VLAAVSDFHVACMQHCGGAYVPHLAALVGDLKMRFAASPSASYLYTAAKMLEFYGSSSRPDVHDTLESLVKAVSATVVGVLRTGAAAVMASHGDMVENYFFMMAEAAAAMPDRLAALAGVEQCVQAGTSALLVDCYSANAAALLFLKEYVRVGAPTQRRGVAAELVARRRPAVAPVVARCGGRIVEIVLRGAAGALAGGLIRDDDGSLSSVALSLRDFDLVQFRAWATAALAGPTLPIDMISPDRKASVLRDLCAATSVDRMDDVLFEVARLGRQYRRRRAAGR